MTGVAIGYLVGVVVSFLLTIIFGACCWINDHEAQMAAIYDPETLDQNAENDPPRNQKNE